MINKISKKTNFLIFFIIVVFLLTVGFVYATILNAYNDSIDMHNASLVSSRDHKTKRIKDFFSENINNINVLSESKDVKELDKALLIAYKEISIKEKKNHPINNRLIKSITDQYEGYFKKFINEYIYQSVYIICAKHGHIIYKHSNQLNNATNLIENSALEKIWKKVKKTNKTVFIDMSIFNNDITMFLGTPVYTNGVFSSVLVLEISSNN